MGSQVLPLPAPCFQALLHPEGTLGATNDKILSRLWLTMLGSKEMLALVGQRCGYMAPHCG